MNSHRKSIMRRPSQRRPVPRWKNTRPSGRGNRYPKPATTPPVSEFESPKLNTTGFRPVHAAPAWCRKPKGSMIAIASIVSAMLGCWIWTLLFSNAFIYIYIYLYMEMNHMIYPWWWYIDMIWYDMIYPCLLATVGGVGAGLN